MSLDFMKDWWMLMNILRTFLVLTGLAGATVLVASNQMEDTFDRTEIGDSWSGHMHSFSIEEGVLVASQSPDAGHGAVIRTPLDFKDVTIDFDVRFEGGERFNFVIDDKNCKEVHAGHICRVSITRKKLTVQDDRTGAMNLELRALKDLPEHKERIASLLESKKSSGKVDFRDDRWYHMKVTIHGERMQAFVDGKRVAELVSEGFAHPTKTQFGFTVTGRNILFDNVTAKGSE